MVPLKKEEFCGHFMSLIGKDAPPFPVSKKLEWDEAVGSFFCLPVEEPLLSFPEGLTKIFSGEELDPVVSEQLMIEIPALSDELLLKEWFGSPFHSHQFQC